MARQDGGARASDPTIGTVTPFSNNAEICSLPRFCADNPWPAMRDTEPMVRALELAAAPTYPDLPTGVGFCFYIRRALLDAIGSFDPVFGLGYGEENDFCLRAAAADFRNVLCEDAFVLHSGSSSFGELRAELSQRNTALLLERHPGYLDLVRGYIAADPLRPLRSLALTHYRQLAMPIPGALHVIHGHGGGTEYHVRTLITSSERVFRHHLLIAVGDEWQLEERADDEIRSYSFVRAPGESWRDFLGGLCARFGIDLIHLHNISGCRDGLMQAVAAVDIPYGYTVHDLNFACPTITFLTPAQTYCGAVTDATTCAACLAAQPDLDHVDIQSWRAKHRTLLALPHSSSRRRSGPRPCCGATFRSTRSSSFLTAVLPGWLDPMPSASRFPCRTTVGRWSLSSAPSDPTRAHDVSSASSN
jgi:hypothetical protein